MSDIRYPTYSELIFINGKLLDDEAIQTGRQKVRDVDLLLAAEQRPQSSAFGEDAYPTLKQKAAALLHSIARNHPFKDGNKRTATIGALFMLETNGQRVQWDAEEALTIILDLAEGRQDMSFFVGWLQTTETAPAREPDVQRDTILIERLLDDHEWLLNELAER